MRATKGYTIEFGNVPEEVWRGETFSSAEEFRECHLRCLPHLCNGRAPASTASAPDAIAARTCVAQADPHRKIVLNSSRTERKTA